MIDIELVNQSDIEYKDEVIELVDEARHYLKSFSWCKEIKSGLLARSFGYILCIFLFEIEPVKNSGADEKLWIIVGDLPPAYFDTIEYKTPHDALDFYCFVMEEWASHIKAGKSLVDYYPVNTKPKLEYADMLAVRIQLIRDEFLPVI